ncbi:MAG TPA: MFS transporter [Candidatus Hydrogenedentes bacterium]|nr:MFS transporter [Candidatus Hydrogenedentota bacterium]HPC17801.1 MFS transporter [Candidatus Hydrogenedentota bacterium]HRT20684.1 MFS transporter [Candidatus Hydrogenedentota bacterium]HRT65720.1 MFS transporter [Candidatus Hydrogenedentota bacterium]
MANNGGLEGIKPEKLFWGSCTALIATAMTFAVLSSIMTPLKEQFLLTNEQAGFIGGAGLWGFPLSILIFGPLCSVLGMRFLLRMAFVFFMGGVLLMVLAVNFWMLFFGALTIAFANGLVEGACNPLVATIYPDRKVEKLNAFHVWFPGGIVIGGLVCFFLDRAGVTQIAGIASWQLKLGMILLPVLAYGAIMLNEKFPETERAQSGVSFGGMVKETLCRPLFLLLFVCMMLTASVELGPNRWIPSVLDAGGVSGMLVLVWTSLLMAIMRQSAGKVVERLAPTGILLTSAILSGLGLLWLSYAEGGVMIFIADTVFAVGICYFWPTMLGVASERVPKGGELALALLGAAGNIAVGLVTIPLMGTIADYYGHEKFPVNETKAVVQRIADELPGFKASAKDNELKAAMDETVALANAVLAKAQSGALPRNDTANVLRGAIKCAPDSEIGKIAKKTLDPAELHGGRTSFRIVSCMAIVLVIVFGALYLRDISTGGYKAERLI